MTRETDFGQAAHLITKARATTAIHFNCLAWDAPGVVKALKGCEGPWGLVVAAGLVAACDASLEKPTTKAFLMHWPVNASAAPEARNDPRCAVHGLSLPCQACEDEHRQDAIAPDQLGDLVQGIRQLLAEVRPEPKPKRRPPALVDEDRREAVRSQIQPEEAQP